MRYVVVGAGFAGVTACGSSGVVWANAPAASAPVRAAAERGANGRRRERRLMTGCYLGFVRKELTMS
jgi:hypothetical protein